MLCLMRSTQTLWYLFLKGHLKINALNVCRFLPEVLSVVSTSMFFRVFVTKLRIPVS